MKKVLGLLLLLILSVSLIQPASIHAAQFYSGNVLNFNQDTQLKDAYVTGNTVQVNTPVTNDLVVAGGSITIQQSVEGSLIAAGNTIAVNNTVGQSARIAGATIIINSRIDRDLLVVGGNVTISKTAIINGDLVMYGGTITIEGVVNGKTIIKGGTATINGTIDNLQDSRIDALHLGPKAIVNNLSFQSPQEAQIEPGAIIHGNIDYQHTNQTSNQPIRNLTSLSFFYNIIASLIFGLVLLLLVSKLTKQSIQLLKKQPAVTLAWGFGITFLLPLAALLIGILSVYLGAASLVLYALSLITAFYLGQILLGWWLLNWWFGRSKETYQIDWRAVVVGVIVTAILLFIPIIGWIVVPFMTILAMGTIGQQLWSLRQS